MKPSDKEIRRNSGAFSRIGLLLIPVFISVVLFAVGYAIIGTEIRGKEFSPQTFQIRDFRYHRFSWTGYRLTSTTFGSASTVANREILQHLKASTTSPRWDVIEVSEGTAYNLRAPAVLTKMLEAVGPDNNYFWNQWSSQNVALAEVLWPIVQEAAIGNHYEIIPALLESAKGADSPRTLEFDCRRILTECEKLKNSAATATANPSSNSSD